MAGEITNMLIGLMFVCLIIIAFAAFNGAIRTTYPEHLHNQNTDAYTNVSLSIATTINQTASSISTSPRSGSTDSNMLNSAYWLISSQVLVIGTVFLQIPLFFAALIGSAVNALVAIGVPGTLAFVFSNLLIGIITVIVVMDIVNFIRGSGRL